MSRRAPPNPGSVEDLTTAWFADALPERLGRVVASERLRIIHGTATKIHVAVQLQAADGSVAERTVWVKTGLEAHSHSIGQDSVYAGEVYYYDKVAGRFPTHTPECFHARFEPDTGRSVLVLEDLLPLGARFAEPVDALSPETAGRALAMIAGYQARSWLHPFVRDDAYLRSGGALSAGRIEDWLFSPENWAEQSRRPRFRPVPKALRDARVWRSAYQALRSRWWKAGPYCLSHGDAHVGQSYRLPDGQVRLLDWQCVMATSWGHDFANFLVSALSPQDRRHAEGDLLKAHLEALREHGVEPPDFDTAWAIYRACAFYGTCWALCKVEMQSEENCTAIAERHLAAAADLGSLDLLEGVPPAMAPA